MLKHLRRALRTPFYWDNVLEELSMMIAWWLPKRLIKWCAIRLMAHATQGKYSSQIVPELKAMDALQRW